MRKVMAFILMTALLMIGAAGRVEAETEVYRSDFSEGMDGWYARSAGGATVAVLPDGVLRIEGRTADWNSPGRDFDLVPGGEYTLSVEVRQDAMDSTAFMISVAHTLDGAETYENLAHGAVSKGEWTELRGSYTAGGFQRFVLYVETTGAPELDFEIRNFCVTAPKGLPEAGPTVAPMAIAAVENMPALKDVYAGLFDFGTALAGREALNARATAFAASQFNIVTPENELKPESVLDLAASKALAREDDTAVAVHFTAARPILDFARDNGLKAHGHVLVWHSQTPEVFFREGYDIARPRVTREVMLVRLENYIREIMAYMDAHYHGLIVSWDVVNEAVDDATGGLRASPWLEVVGEDYPHRAFELARKYAPEGTLLYYNDYNTAYLNKQNGIVKLLESLLAEGNIDGYGFQMHHAVATPTLAEITASVERVASLGMRLRVSELDIAVDDNGEASFRRQAALYGSIMRLLKQHSDQVEAVQVWGMADNLSWRAGQYPLLFDANYNPKPAFWAVADPDSDAE